MNLRRKIRRSKLVRRLEEYRKLRKGAIRQELDSLERAYRMLIKDIEEEDDDSPFWSVVRENYPERVFFLMTSVPDKVAEILLEEVDRKGRMFCEQHIRAVVLRRFSDWYDHSVYGKLEEASDDADKEALIQFAEWFQETTGEGGCPWQIIRWFKTSDTRRRMADMMRLRLKPAMEKVISEFDFSEPKKGGRVAQFLQRHSRRAAARRRMEWRQRAVRLGMAMRDVMRPIIINEFMIQLFADEVQEILAESVRREKQFILDHSF